jgi:glycosyltransferase involved in cell wall biosynthesis
MTMLLTVAVCTWNRSALLQQTLGSLAGTRVPAGLEWEVVVVANRCTDDTAAVVARAATQLPIRLIDEQRLGLSHARNSATRAARGRYIVWIDDDVLVSTEWLAAYAEAVQAHPAAMFFGGPIHPWFPTPPPAWLEAALPSVGNALSLLDYGTTRDRFDRDHLPFGANFAIRTAAQRRHPYDPRLGRRGTDMRSGEETAVLHRVLAEGGEGVWVPNATLRHYVSAERQTREYLRRYYFNNGAAHSMQGYGDAARGFLGRPLWLWRQALTNELAYWLRRPFTGPVVWGAHLRAATTAWGQLYGVRRKQQQRTPLGAPALPEPSARALRRKRKKR